MGDLFGYITSTITYGKYETINHNMLKAEGSYLKSSSGWDVFKVLVVSRNRTSQSIDLHLVEFCYSNNDTLHVRVFAVHVEHYQIMHVYASVVEVVIYFLEGHNIVFMFCITYVHMVYICIQYKCFS